MTALRIQAWIAARELAALQYHPAFPFRTKVMRPRFQVPARKIAVLERPLRSMSLPSEERIISMAGIQP
ncbi:hypothetical protein FHG87_015833 [Trinorchestia longiramus]|nr:hypothetical protein FHG87_015833 [Trinorchestia longiramus]